MSWNSILSYLFYGFVYFFAFILLFAIIYRAYISWFGIKPHECMSDKCIQKRKEESVPEITVTNYSNPSLYEESH